jgi:SAM-dependent methyltransferase
MPEKCFYDISNVKKQDKFEYPDFIARFYDVIYNNIRSGVDHEFYLEQVSKCKGKILEVGVGTGRFFIDALNSGADIYGIDVSRSMIDILRGKISDEYHNRVFVKDICDLNLDMKFDLIIAPFRIFQHILDTEDQLIALNNIHRHLNSGCSFIFDVYVPDLNILWNGIDNVMDFEGEYEPGHLLRRFVTANSNLIEQINEIKMTFEWEENNGIIRREWMNSMRYFFRFELENLIKSSNLRLSNMYGDFNKGKLNNESRDFVIICRNDPLKITD